MFRRAGGWGVEGGGRTVYARECGGKRERERGEIRMLRIRKAVKKSLLVC